jgi:hypothetical protein
MSRYDNERSSELEVEPPFDQHRLLIEGLAENCTDEMVQLYLMLVLNADLDDAFKIEEFVRNRSRVMIKMNRILQYEQIVTRQKKVPELCGSTINFLRVKVPNTIRVCDLSNNCTKEVLNLYFSNTKISNGGDIKNIKLYNFENKALVEFKNYHKVEEVLSKMHILCESSVRLEKYYGPIEEEYFREEEELVAQGYVEVEKSNSSSTSLSSSQKEKDKSKKTRSLAHLSTLKSFSTQSVAIDKTKLIVSNIQENVNMQQLDFYIQLLTNKAEINEINWSLENKGKILIDFKKEMDISKILYEFNNNFLNNLNGKQIQIETVNVTRTLVVLVKDAKVNNKDKSSKLDSLEDYDEELYRPEFIPATRDLLELYFVNRQRSGGGDVESIERRSSRYWLIVMKDQRAVREIASRKHIIDEKPIKVFPYFENFGLPYLFKPLFDDYHTTSSSSAAFKLKIKDERLRYFCRVKSLHRKLNDILSESNAISKYNKQESNFLYVNYIEKLSTKVPYTERIWRLKVKESVEYFLQIYKYEKLTLSFNQWTTISKTKQLGDSLLSRTQISDEDVEEGSVHEGPTSTTDTRIRYLGNSCSIISINETSTNVEISIVGPNAEVDKFIVKIKDVICKAYFTFELEEKIIKFKTYLFECEELLAKWLNDSDGMDSDTEVVLSSARSNDSDSLSIAYGRKSEKLNKSKRQTIDEFLSRLERDHLDMELSYGKLFQELGYTFLNQAPQESSEVDSDEYKEFNDRLSSSLDETVKLKNDSDNQSQMDKIKKTLDDLKSRINEMRKKFRTYSIKSKRNKNTRQVETSEGEGDELEDDEENEDQIKLHVYVKDQNKILTFSVNRKCKIKELKATLFDKFADAKVNSMEDLVITYNNLELANDIYSISDYGINDKSNITLEFLESQ